MALRTSKELAAELKELGLEGRVVGVHSNLTSIGLIAPSPISPSEEKRGMSPIGKTVINAFMDAVGPEGTFFVPTHSLNFVREGVPLSDEGYYRKASSPSLVGALTQAVIQDDRVVRSEHPTHSTAAIGKEAEYLAFGHTPLSQPVGIYNAFSKTVGLDGIILFVGNTIKSNTTFHAYETLMLPDMAGHFTGTALSTWQGRKQAYPQTWTPAYHRDFYAEKKRRTRAIIAMRESGLLKEAVLGRGPVYYYEAKDMAKYFAEKTYPKEPDILFCNKPEDCNSEYECGRLVGYLKAHYAKKDGSWDSEKIRSRMNPQFLEFLKPGVRRMAVFPS